MVMGVAASMRFFVSRVARRQMEGIIISASKPEAKKPRTKYMTFSIIKTQLPFG